MNQYKDVKRWGDKDPKVTVEYIKTISDLVVTMSVEDVAKTLNQPQHKIKRIIDKHTVGVLAIRAKYKWEKNNGN